MTSFHTAALTAVALTAFAGACPAQTLPPTDPGTYGVTRIDPLPGHSSLDLSAINNRGEAIGISLGSPITNQQPVIYRPGANGAPGTLTPIPLPPGKAFSVPTDINDHGIVCGYAQTTWSDEQGMTPWLWDSTTGQLTLFPARGVATANNINNAGVFVGRSCLSGTNLTCYYQGSTASQATTQVGSGNMYSSSQWRLIDINDAGQILYTPPQPAVGIRREADGTQTPLPASPDSYPRTYTGAINDSGLSLARYETNVGSQYFSKAFVWSPESGRRFVGVTGNFIFGRGLNDLGQVVGETGNNRTSVMSVWLNMPDGQNVDVRALPETSDIFIDGVRGINNHGQILASAFTPIDDFAVILTPPAPPAVCTADLGSQGGVASPDGQLDNNDFIAFINHFFAADPRADLGVQGGIAGADGFYDNNDFIAFINAFFAGCP